MAVTYTVQQGDHISGIAEQFGFMNYLTIWEHPNNAELKQKRKDPHVLFAGDKLFIPDKQEKSAAVPTTKLHRFRLAGPPLRLRIGVWRFYEKPLANTKLTLAVEDKKRDLTTDGAGVVELEIPSTSRNASLSAPGVDIPVQIGFLDPEDTPSGQLQRLANLGYYAGPLEPVDEERLQSAIEEFQCENGLAVDGKCGPATQAKLKAVHGS